MGPVMSLEQLGTWAREERQLVISKFFQGSLKGIVHQCLNIQLSIHSTSSKKGGKKTLVND